MYKQAKPFFMIVQTPLHAGSGQDLGIVDLPIQRERHTSFPKIEGSSLKGAIREVFEGYTQVVDKKYQLITIEENKETQKDVEGSIHELTDKPKKPIEELKTSFNEDVLNTAWQFHDNKKKNYEVKKDKDGNTYCKYNEAISLSFGPEEGDAHAGALGFTDARLLLFPVKSMKGVFAYITCPYVLKRFKEDLELNSEIKTSKSVELDKLDELAKLNTTLISCEELLEVKKENSKSIIILEEYTFKAEVKTNLKTIIDLIPDSRKNENILDKETMKKRLVLLPDDDFKDFVNLSTEVITRTKINPETGTVQSGALFTEEYLPAESVLYSLALTTPIFMANDSLKGIFTKEENGSDDWKKHEESRVMKFFELGLPDVMQIGGNATIGKGIVRTAKWNGGVNNG